MVVGIATHDSTLIAYACERIEALNLAKEQYEFQMLLGVTPHLRQKLLTDGHPVRIYVPYGQDWYGYSTRRLQENPTIAGHVFRQMLSRLGLVTS